MNTKVSISILMDDYSTNENFLCEHGFALWIEADGKRILFDTGQSAKFIANANAMGIDIESADYLVLSHGHYDHTGGLARVLKQNKKCSVYCHSGVFEPRYSLKQDGALNFIGIPADSAKALHSIIDRIHWVTTPVYFSENIGISGPVPRISAYEDTGGKFYLDPGAERPDWIQDDMAIWVNTPKGLILITGCCHSGLINTIDHAFRTSGSNELDSIVGGLHLLNASGPRLRKTADKLEKLHVSKVFACHCTGEIARNFLGDRLGEVIVKGQVGMKIEHE